MSPAPESAEPDEQHDSRTHDEEQAAEEIPTEPSTGFLLSQLLLGEVREDELAGTLVTGKDELAVRSGRRFAQSVDGLAVLDDTLTVPPDVERAASRPSVASMSDWTCADGVSFFRQSWSGWRC